MSPGIAVGPAADESWMGAAVREAGGTQAPLAEADALIWYGTASDLAPVLKAAPNVRWIQLPAAGVEDYLALMDGGDRIWTAAKGVYANPCAEHALGLAIAGFRHMDAGARSPGWRKLPGKTLFGANVVVVGGAGGIGQALLRLLKPFGVKATSVRRRSEPTPGADRTVAPEDFMGTLGDADLVVLAAPLTSETGNMVAEAQLRAMKNDAWLVNVARGRLVKTDDLVKALVERWIGGAGLDVTDPEPLPAEHPLWRLDNCIITSHTANPPNLDQQLYRRRIVENVRRFLRGQPLIGVVDPRAGY